jgi:hypothetical protein
MFNAPLIILDGDFNLPQHLFTDLADRCAQGIGCVRRVPVKDA